MSDPISPATEFTAAIESFETALLTPITSGDLPDWLEKLKSAWKHAADILRGESRLHQQQLDEIAVQDPELLFRVEQLRAEDIDLNKQCERIDQAVTRLSDLGPRLEPDEERARRPTQQAIDEGLALVTRVRRQKIAMQTWYNEAFNRDRGPVD